MTATLASRLSPWEPLGYAALRVGYGLVMLTHGIPKALRIPHGSVADPLMATAGLIQRALGLPFAFEIALLVTLLEMAGALLLALGVWTRAVAAAFVAEMIGISVAMGPAWPWADRGMEYPVALAVLAGYVVLRGPGAYALRR